MDPFVDVVQLLRPRATLFSKIEGFGQWGLGFRKRDDLLFCRVEQGECYLLRPDLAPVLLRPDDFVLIRTSTPFSLASDPEVKPKDSEDLVAAAKSVSLRLGEGTESSVVLRGGRFVFDTANEALLWELLPSLLHVVADDTSSWRVRSLLKLNEMETLEPGPGSEFLIARLMELILVEMLRRETPKADVRPTGLIAGLLDPSLAGALLAMHGEIAREWSVAELARLCGVSRSGFATRFRDVLGVGPIEYLMRWRMAVAKDELRRGTRSIGEIALAVGFQSSSAFSTSFTRAVGCSPKRFAGRIV
ncbi:MAG: AraC family transcriptional regulator [Janthinobacterium lividum]